MFLVWHCAFLAEDGLANAMFLGVAADLGHINTNSVVTGHNPSGSGLGDALKGSEVVLIPAGVPRKPGMTRDGMSTDFDLLFSTHRN